MGTQVVARRVCGFVEEGEGGCSREGISEVMVEALSVIRHESALFKETKDCKAMA